jgi:hypothetical protein
VAAHDLGHLDAVRRAAGRRGHDGRRVAEILRPDRSWRNGTECLDVLGAAVVEAVDGAARDAERLAGPKVNALAIDRPRVSTPKIHDILRDIEREWTAELGPRPFADLKALLTRIWESPLIR